nr:hypothetical protein [Tanacetum cinerariifolium]
MNTTQAQQKALDDAFVSPVDHLEFGKCNMRLKTDIEPKEATFQVMLDTLSLTPFYQAFLIIVVFPAIYIHEKTQVYGAILPHHLTNQAMLEAISYQTYYAYATGEKAPKEKLKSSTKVAKTDKKKQTAKMPKTKGLDVLTEIALTKAEQINLATKRSKKDFHMSHAGGLGDEVDTQLKSDEESCTFSQDEDDDDEETDVNDDSEETKFDNDGDDLTHPNLSTYKADDEEEEEEEEEKADDEEVSSDQRVSTPPEYELTEEEENKEGDDEDMEANQDTKDTHVTLTTVPPIVQHQSSSVSSDKVSKFINPSMDTGGSSSQKYTTFVTKTKAVDYGQVKWIEDKVYRIWSPKKVIYDKHAYWGTYHWGLKRKRFYGDASNMESSYDVCSRHRIIVVTSLMIMEWFGSSHLEEIIVRREDDKLYKFKECDFKRLRRQDIEDMLLLFVQDKLSNLNLEERNRLMRTDKLHKFSDGTLNHVCTALNDIATGIEMDYLTNRK